jgi:hypothetical protein
VRSAGAGVARDKLSKTYKLGRGKSGGEVGRNKSCRMCGGKAGGGDDGLCCEVSEVVPLWMLEDE